MPTTFKRWGCDGGRRRGLHWFWRAGIAVCLAFAIQNVLYVLAFVLLDRGSTSLTDYLEAFIQYLVWTPLHLLVLALAIWIYLALTRRFAPPPDAREIRCGKCGSILRGLAEPRCPRCGESV